MAFIAEQMKNYRHGYVLGCTLPYDSEHTTIEFCELIRHHLPVTTSSYRHHNFYVFFISDETFEPLHSIHDFHSILEDDLGETLHLFKSTRLEHKNNWSTTLTAEMDLFFKMLREEEMKFLSTKHVISKHIEHHIFSLLTNDYSWYIDSFKHIDISLIQTIKCLIEENLNIVECSRQMYLHRNTVMYRINRFQELSGFDLKNTQDRLVCYHICNILVP